MNASINERTSPELGLQPQTTSPQPRAIICPKCQHQRTAADQGPDWQCPSCGIAYNKATARVDVVVHQVNTTSSARGRLEIDRDGWETSTPGPISISLKGRIGRLRYLAFSWPIMALSGAGIVMAVLGPLRQQPPNIPLLVLVGVLWFWLSLRLMALRLHDVNRSAKWLLALLLLPGLSGALGGRPQLAAIGGGLFWLVALLLLILPGSEGDNDYGPPPEANTGLVKMGAVLLLALMAVGIVGNLKYMRYISSGKLHPALSSVPGTATQDRRLTKSDLVGTWEGPKISLRVDNSGNGDLFRLDGNSTVRAFGPLRVLDGNRISIGLGLDPPVLRVTVPPHVEGAATRMTLDGIEMIRTGS